MRAQLEQRLNELKTEFETGQKMLTDLESRQANLRETLLRISGAIQVLEELLVGQRQQSGTDEQDASKEASKVQHHAQL